MIRLSAFPAVFVAVIAPSFFGAMSLLSCRFFEIPARNAVRGLLMIRRLQ